MTQAQVFDLDAAIASRVAHYHTEQVKKQLHEDGERRQQLGERRAECEQALAKAFPAEIREALGMEVAKNSVENSINGYPVKGYPEAVFALDDHLWHITLEYGHGVYISAPDGVGSKQTANNDENVDALLLMIGLWREREAERARQKQEEDAAVARLLVESASPAASSEPTAPRMVGDSNDTNVVFVLSEHVSHYSAGLDQMQAKFSYEDVYLTLHEAARKPRRFTLTSDQLDALIAARSLYQQHIDAVKMRREERARVAADNDDDIPF